MESRAIKMKNMYTWNVMTFHFFFALDQRDKQHKKLQMREQKHNKFFLFARWFSSSFFLSVNVAEWLVVFFLFLSEQFLLLLFHFFSFQWISYWNRFFSVDFCSVTFTVDVSFILYGGSTFLEIFFGLSLCQIAFFLLERKNKCVCVRSWMLAKIEQRNGKKLTKKKKYQMR